MLFKISVSGKLPNKYIYNVLDFTQCFVELYKKCVPFNQLIIIMPYSTGQLWIFNGSHMKLKEDKKGQNNDAILGIIPIFYLLFFVLMFLGGFLNRSFQDRVNDFQFSLFL